MLYQTLKSRFEQAFINVVKDPDLKTNWLTLTIRQIKNLVSLDLYN